MDMRTIFINGELEETVYMDQPKLFFCIGKGLHGL